MEVEYRRDLNHNYMVVHGHEGVTDISYCFKMLSRLPIEGVLGIERRVVDNKTLYYYDITAKQSISNFYNKATLSCHQVKQMLYSIIKTIEESYEYLLSEDDFVLDPDFVYLNISNNKPYLCYYSGYNKSIRDQMSELIEFLMEKVDYKDKEAVYLIYSMYSTSKQEAFTFVHLKEALHNMKNNMDELKETIDKRDENNINVNSSNIDELLIENPNTMLDSGKQNLIEESNNKTRFKIPVMMEKVISEQELLCYPCSVYVYTGVVIIMGLLITVFCIKSKILYNSIGSRIDYAKLLGILLIVILLGGYLLRLIWDKKNRISKIGPKKEYIDPWEDDIEDTKNNKAKVDFIKEDTINENNNLNNSKNSINTYYNYPEENYNHTCILNESSMEAITTPIYILRSVENSTYEDIIIKDFPFFIGKLKKNVDYFLDNDAVSRYHAKITKEDGIFYLFDLNSRNGTYLNDERLITYQRNELIIGDLVIFADVKYHFEIT